VVEVASKDELDERLKGLRSGQYAIVAFSAPWCGPCKEYIPEFRKTAESSGGRFLFILVENEEIDWMKECGVTGVPTVRIFDHLKRAVTVDKNEPFDGILELSLSVEAVFELGRSKLEAGDKEGLKLILKAAGSAPSLAMSKDLKAFVRAFDDKDLLTSVLGARGIVALRERLDIFPSMDEGAMLVTKAEEYLNNMEESYGELEYSEMSYEINRDEKVILEHLERAIELFPKNISAHLLKFDTLQRLGRHKEALAGSERVIELNEDDYMGYYLKSLALTGLEEYPMAIVYTRRALDKQPADKAHISHLHQVIGNAKRHMGDMNGAKKSFLTAIDNDPMALDYMNLAGVLVVPDFVQFGARTFKEAGAEANAVWAFNFGKIGLGPKLGAGYAHDTVYAGQTFDLTGGAAVFYKGNDLLIGADAGIGRSFSLVEDERHSPAINGWFYDYGV
jgi:tetratricopeptide (TPR) repeat protein